MTGFSALTQYFLLACILTCTVLAKPKNVIYWGQESDGPEQPLRHYCDSGNYDIIVMGFAYEFPTPSTGDSQYPALNFASHCETAYDDANPLLLICPGIGADITYCQSLGIEIIMSFGGGVGRYGFSSDSQAVTFATLVWNMFMEGTHPIRPFGTAIISGVDLDIEGGGTTGYVAFINQLRTYFATSQRNYVISSAPQCVFPDGRLGPGAGTALGEAWFDYVWVQFYNNYCGLEFLPYLTVPQFNFDVWAGWARTGSLNKNVKVFLGAPAAASAVGAGFVDITKLQAYASSVMASYSDVYGGIMLWDASNSDNNGNFGALVSAIIKAQGGSTPTPVPVTVTPVPVTVTPVPVPVTPAPVPVTPVPVPVIPVTTGKTQAGSTSTTTGKTQAVSTSTTTGKAQSGSTTTTGKTQAGSTSTTTTGKTQAGSTSTSTSSTPSSTSCSSNYMKCLTSETYSMCDHGNWGAAQSCQHGLTCTPSGNYIYCL